MEKDGKKKEEKMQKINSGIFLMKHNRLRVLSESATTDINVTSKSNLINSNDNYSIYKRNISTAEKIKRLKNQKYHLRKNRMKIKAKNPSLTFSANSSISNNDSISLSNSSNSKSSNSSELYPNPFISSFSGYQILSKNKNNNISSNDTITTTTTTSSLDYYENSGADPSTLAQPIRQELQIRAKETISDVILACRSLVQTSGISNEINKSAYNYSLLDSVFVDIDTSLTKMNQQLEQCKQKNTELLNSFEKATEAQEGCRRIKDLLMAYITDE